MSMKRMGSTYGEGQTKRRTDPEEVIAKVQAAAEEMTMRRYTRTTFPQEGWEPGYGSFVCQMEELNRVLDYQNKILVELLTALDRLTAVVEQKNQIETDGKRPL